MIAASSDQESDLVATGLAPTEDMEPAILATLASGSHTMIVRGKSTSVGHARFQVSASLRQTRDRMVYATSLVRWT